jgi:propane monooxygenase small subunit
MQAAAANHDFITPPVVSAAEADYERNLANTIDLIYLLANDEKHGAANRRLFQGWVNKHGALADKAALGLQPIWSMPHSKPISFPDVRAQSEERIGQILGELGLTR